MEREFDMDPTNRDPASFLNGFPSQILSESLARSALLENGYYNHTTTTELPVLTTMQVEQQQDYHFGHQFNGTNQGSILMPPGSRFRSDHLAFDGGLSANNVSGSSENYRNGDFHDAIASGSLSNIMGNQSILSSSDQEMSSEMLSSLLSRGCSNPSNSSTTNYNRSTIDDINNTSWDSSTKYLIQPDQEFAWRTSTLGFNQQIQFGENMGVHQWLTATPMTTNICSDHHNEPYDTSSGLNNELSLSLATCGPTAVCGTTTNVQLGQCSDMSCSIVSRHSNQFESGDHNCSNSSRELSLSFPNSTGGNSTQHSQVILGSRYLHVIQEILSEISSYSLENVNLVSHSKRLIGSHSEHPSISSIHGDGDGVLEVTPVEPFRQRKEIEAKKTHLLALLQMVDDQYNQSIDEIHTVTSAFHAATELDPQTHARFSLQTISTLYKSLRERISTQILRLGAQEDDTGTSTTGASGARDGDQRPMSFLQRQWTIQQLKKKDQQLWRPQRGLPERSVSVLRAWMFQNFLHPYPKDSEKHLLAIRSGLTRSQVSNWFINARVRLWKPLIEEMYSEVNRRNKARTNKEGTDKNCINQTSMYYPRFEMNDSL